MSGTVIILIVVFLVVMYLITFAFYQKHKSEKTDMVEKYRETYRENDRKSAFDEDAPKGISNYVTKYNSSEDYREKH